MADFPLIGDGQRITMPTTLGASRGATITPSGTANTKGAWASLATAAANIGGVALLLDVLPTTAAGADWLLDIAVGAAGSEVVIAENLLVTNAGLAISHYYLLPIHIPPGVQVRARCQVNGTGANTLHVNCQIIQQGALPSQPLSRVTSYGPDTTDSGAVSVDPGGTANTKGAWVELSASIRRVSLALITVGNQGNAARTNLTNINYALDIGVGAAGAEQVVVPNLVVRSNFTTDANFGTVLPPLPLAIPAGSRLAARAQTNTTDATDRTIDVAVYGID